jgi:hypothetical protein
MITNGCPPRPRKRIRPHHPANGLLQLTAACEHHFRLALSRPRRWSALARPTPMSHGRSATRRNTVKIVAGGSMSQAGRRERTGVSARQPCRTNSTLHRSENSLQTHERRQTRKLLRTTSTRRSKSAKVPFDTAPNQIRSGLIAADQHLDLTLLESVREPSRAHERSLNASTVFSSRFCFR